MLNKLNEIKENFSNKQTRLFEKVQKLVGEKVAIALINMQGVNGTSQAEIEVMANIILIFKQLKIKEFEELPQKLVLEGDFIKNYFVNIIPQYKSDNFSIDLVIELYQRHGLEGNYIAKIGLEYDGHVAHYVETGIKKAYKRDAKILSNGIPLIKLSPEQKNDLDDTKKAIWKYFRHQIKLIDNALLNKRAHPKVNLSDNCPVCSGIGSLANEFCPECNGLGKVTHEHFISIDLLKHSNFNCPDCLSTIIRSCRTCSGRGWITRDKALEWQNNHYNNT